MAPLPNIVRKQRDDFPKDTSNFAADETGHKSSVDMEPNDLRAPGYFWPTYNFFC